MHSSLQSFLLSVSITALHILLILAVMQQLHLETAIFTTVVGAFGVAAGLALSGTLQNFAGGVLILILKPFELSDTIRAQGQEGKVTSIQIFYTVLLTVDNKTIIIPNGKLFNEVIVNITRENQRRLDFEIEMTYAANPETVMDLIADAVKTAPGVLVDRTVNIGITKLSFDRVTFGINIWAEPAEFLNVKTYIHEEVVKKLMASGVKFPGT